MAIFAATLRGSVVSDAGASARMILDSGFQALGLATPFWARDWESCRALLPAESIVAVELCAPLPRVLRPGEGFRPVLGSPRREDKELAVTTGGDTIRFADEIEARTVIVPPAVIEGDLRRSYRRARSASTFRQWLPALGASRAAESAVPLDACRSVISRLLDIADRYGVRLALVPGGWIDEVPSPQEALAMLREFRGGPLALWLDTLRLAVASETDGSVPFEGLEIPLAGATIRDHGDDLEPAALGSGRLAWDGQRSLLLASGVWMVDPPAGSGGVATVDDLEFLTRLAQGPAKKSPGILSF